MSWILLIIGLFEVGFASCLSKEWNKVESTYWMLGFFLSKYKYATAV
jgi:hypothetical protein